MINPLEWVAYIHGKLFAGLPWAGFVLAGVISLTIGLLVWARGVDKYREQQRQSFTISSDAPPTAPLAAPIVVVPQPTDPKPAPSTGAPSVSEKDKPPSQKFNVTSNNQQGGITAGIVNLGPKPWGLDEGHLDLLTQRLTRHAQAEQSRDLINSVMGDTESARFASNLVAAFRRAGWNLPGSGFSQSVFSGPVEGVVLKVKQAESMPSVLTDLIVTLREAGIEPSGELDDKLAPGEFEIIVGSRPATRR